MKYILIPTKKEKQDKVSLKNLSNQELVELYKEKKDWLEKHEAKTGTSNLFDVSGDSYNPEKYEENLKLLEKVSDEGRERKILYFLSDDEKLRVVRDVFGQDCHWTDKEDPSLPPTVANQKGD